MTLKYVLFDLDDTLYPRDLIMPAIDENIKIFLMDILHITYDAAERKRVYYNKVYGTVLRGLLQEETVDVEKYLEFVHDVPVADYLKPDPALAEMLASISLQKYIFTNSYRTHAENVMNALGVREFFEDIFDIVSVDYVSKPARHSYLTVVSKLHTVPEVCVYIDDKAVNLEEPKKMGMRTILIDDVPNKWVDVMVKEVHDVGRVIDQFSNESPTETAA